MKSGSVQGREMTIGQLLMQVCRLSGERMRVKMEKIGLHRGQGFLLMHLCHGDGMSQQEIARAKHVSPPTVTNMLKRMERDGWIERRRDDHDDRVVRVYATDKARAMHEEARASIGELEDEVTGALTDDERAAFRDYLERIHSRLLSTSARDDRGGENHHLQDTGLRRGDAA